MSEELALEPPVDPPGALGGDDDSPSLLHRRRGIDFFVAKGEREYGPFVQSDILAMLQSGEVTKRDLIYYESLGEWAPIEKVFIIQEQLIHFMDEGQEPEVVLEVYNIISDMLGTGEEIYYIAHQGKRFLRSHRDVVIVTNKRLLVLKYHITSHEVEDYLWSNVVSVQAKEGLMGNVFALRLTSGPVIEVDGLPHGQLNKLIQLSQEMRT